MVEGKGERRWKTERMMKRKVEKVDGEKKERKKDKMGKQRGNDLNRRGE